MASSSTLYAKNNQLSGNSFASLERDGYSYLLMLRQAYGSKERIGIRITKKQNGRTVDVTQYDLKGSLPKSKRESLTPLLEKAFLRLAKADTFDSGVSELEQLTLEKVADRCRFEPITN